MSFELRHHEKVMNVIGNTLFQTTGGRSPTYPLLNHDNSFLRKHVTVLLFYQGFD